MQAAQAGDMHAYERLLREVTPKLRQMVRKRRQFFTAEEIEDLVQEILLSVHAVRATFDRNVRFCHGCPRSLTAGSSTVRDGIIGANHTRSRWTNSP